MKKYICAYIYAQAKTFLWSCWLGHALKKMESKKKYADSPSHLCNEALTVEGLKSGFSAPRVATLVCALFSWS